MVVASIVDVLVNQLPAVDFDLICQIKSLPVGLGIAFVLSRGIPRNQYAARQLLRVRCTDRLAISLSLSTGTLPFLIASSSRFPSIVSGPLAAVAYRSTPQGAPCPSQLEPKGPLNE
jgi:hypothetical protein